MKSPLQLWTNFNQWLQNIPEKAIESAYHSAVAIKVIEDQQFQGQAISPQGEGGRSVYDYYKSALDRELAKINISLMQLRISNFFEWGKGNDIEAEIREKLNFIESVIGKYRQATEEKLTALEKFPRNQPVKTSSSLTTSEVLSQNNPDLRENFETKLGRNPTARKRRYSEEYEQEVIQELRQLREKRKITWRIFALLIIVPLVVQVFTKNFIYTPLLATFKVDKVQLEQIKITEEIGERFLEEYRRFRDSLEIGQFLNPEQYTDLNKQEKLREKAKELVREAGYQTQEGFANILADVTALLSFLGIVYFRQRQCRIALNFLSENFLGLNVITQVFIFILLTDMFVGFHSAEGWEVLLTKTFTHLGIPENSAFNGLFIATIPVILDSTFKLLIFNYFTRRSPTAVAVLEKMNQ